MKTYEECQLDIRYVAIKRSTIETINHYVTNGLRPGSFCRAVLANDLVEAFARADQENSFTMPAIASYLYNEIPGRHSGCWGSYEATAEWIRRGGMEGIAKAAKAAAEEKLDGEGHTQ